MTNINVVDVVESKKVSGLSFFLLALCAFAGIATEMIHVLFTMPVIFGASGDDWTTAQSIIHWIITCITWGFITFVLVRVADRKFQFNLFAKSDKVKPWQWITVVVGVVFTLAVSYKNWNGFKVVMEYHNNGWLLFIFQYIYYLVETALFTLIIVFGQKAFEIWFKKENFPYGGVLVALTWGLAHVLTKGSLQIGLFGALSGFLFGTAYLLVNRDIKKTFVILFIMFII